MKKFCAVLLAVLLASLSGACSLGKKKPEAPPSSSSSAQSGPSEESAPDPGEETPPAPEAAEDGSPADAARRALDALKNLDAAQLPQYIDGMSSMAGLTGETKRAAELLVENLSCEFGEAAVDGDTAVIPAAVSNKDFKGVVTALLPSAVVAFAKNPDMSPSEIEEAFSGKLCEQLEDTGDVMAQRDVDLTLKKKDGNWKVVLDEAAADALSGGLLGEISSLTGKLGVSLPGAAGLFGQS